ncbi:hypothetical protein E1293_03295 [Actinomadura darangshiensis]|uniref:Uncharacterized protein n=1 Tax=Actinomadura darangshiensis TaxID=705336 RepID=A0A4R5BTL8_9ACTN|nr:hypothetical protein [Actinomadura darangshiensis]TDD90421.1 hypothetical protein E1293_03295 [Actinomadura darangshiensis]
MMKDKEPSTTGTCAACRRTFEFDPQSVSTVLIDPDTGLPPGMTVLATLRQATPEAVARSTDEPICPQCVTRAQQFQAESASTPTWDTWP